jgi:glucose/arabinose dehydrogenase
MDRRLRGFCVVCLLLVGCGGQSSVQRSGETTAQPSAPSAQVTAQPSAPPASTTSDQPWRLQLVSIVEGLEQPVHATHAGDGSGRLFVVEKAGRIRVVRDGVLASEAFLDITDRVGASGSEQGLLSVAFHPRYGTNGLFFVNYTDLQGDTMVARFRVTSDANRADPASETAVLTVEQPAANHNGGQIAFGPDGYLYIGMGDGGGAGDRYENAQNHGVLLGKMLRIDVDAGEPYGVPPDNPFVGTEGARPEIWSMGLRNPWRFSFDRTTGDMFIADVGQNRLEEINFEPAGQGGADYGWNIMEGGECYQPSRLCEREGLVEPIAEYGHEHGCSVTGGMRYRGRGVPAFGSAYFFGDYCSGTIWMLTTMNDRWTMTHLLDSDISLSSFAEDEQGELYVLDMSEGTMYRLGAAS